MKDIRLLLSLITISTVLTLAGCATTNSVPYKASATNVISIQESIGEQGKEVSLGSVTFAPGVGANLTCRLMGPVKVSPGKTIPKYIEDAFKEELFLAHVYDPNASIVLDGQIDAISFSSVSPANWKISMSVKSNYAPGYSVSVDYGFDTSWAAYSACRNVANAFGPAVQELLNRVVTNPQFLSLVK